MLETKFPPGFTELSCHPGYFDPDFESAYSIERETELQTLCDPVIKEKLAELQIQLISFRGQINLGVDHYGHRCHVPKRRRDIPGRRRSFLGLYAIRAGSTPGGVQCLLAGAVPQEW
jgi:hypothetical protein